MAVTINRHFPDFYRRISELPDYRKRPEYKVRELIVSGLLVFLFKQKSRNQADNTAKSYYQLMQMADIINQLTYKIVQVQSFINNFGLTVNALIKDILSYLKAMEFDDFVLIEDILAKNVQLRY